MAISSIDRDGPSIVNDGDEGGALICPLKRRLFEQCMVEGVARVDAGRKVQGEELGLARSRAAGLEDVCEGVIVLGREED